MRRFALVLIALAMVACREEPRVPVERPLRVVQLTVGRGLNSDKTIAERTRVFSPSDTIYLSVTTDGAAPPAELKVRWFYEDGQIINETIQAIAPRGPAATEFHLSKSDGWPVGRYKVEISLNDLLAGSRDFEVK